EIASTRMGIKSYDYIIAGAGASGLSLAWYMLQSPLAERNVLIVDSDLRPKNDKTWCFWHAGDPPFADIIRKRWEFIEVGTRNRRFSQQAYHYPYYGLRSIDFKKKILSAIKSTSSFHLLEEPIKSIFSSPKSNGALLHTKRQTYRAPFIFQSCFDPLDLQKADINYPLKQHFVGWEVSTQRSVFNDTVCTLMDFNEEFSDGIAFMYLLPWDTTSALLEYTVFSDQTLPKKEYEEKLSLYLNNRFELSPVSYQIIRKEYGVIPMEDRPFIPWYKPHVMNIGSQGGMVKPSTGYAFMRIQKQTQCIVHGLITEGRPPPSPTGPKRFKAYDLWLLQILHDHPEQALRIFHHLFKRNTIDQVFRF